jgi:hypothetical protein
MADIRSSLKTAIALAVSNMGLKFSTFALITGFNDFLIDVFDSGRSPTLHEIAALVLTRLTNGTGNQYDQAVVLAVVEFLDKAFDFPTDLSDNHQRLCDLKAAYTAGYDQCLRWAQSWYR